MYNYYIKEFTLWADYGQTLTSDNTSGKIEDWVVLYKTKQNDKESETETDSISQEKNAI